MDKEKIVLIDGHSILNRAFYGVPDLTNSRGLHTNAIYGFLNIMLKVLEEENPQYLAVAFDRKESTFRHTMYPEYKGTRKPMPEELHQQVPVMKQVLKAMGITVMELPGFEADDILGTMAKRSEAKGRSVSVISGDRDLLQLASENILIRIPKTKKGVTTVEDYNEQGVKEAYGVTPLQFIDMKALMGDSSDNIPGVPGIGEKGAGAIIAAYGSIENAYENREQITPKRAREALSEHYDMAQMSKVLATIEINAPIPEEWMNCCKNDIFTAEAYEEMKKLEFKALAARFARREEKDDTIVFSSVADRKEAEKLLLKLAKQKELGFAVIEEDEKMLAVAFSCPLEEGTENVFVLRTETEQEEAGQLVWDFSGQIKNESSGNAMTEEWLREKLVPLWKGSALISVPDFKAVLRHYPEAEEAIERVMDAEVGAYLLNPLKSTYHYDDIARDVLGKTLPSYLDMAGKKTLAKLSEEGGEVWEKAAGYPAMTARMAGRPLKEKLSESGMWELYTKIERPLIAVLYHMEERGVRVEKEALCEYGENLQSHINEMQQEIYTETGCKFNINSPKQLGEVLFEKMQLPGGKKTKSGFSTAADVLEKLAEKEPVVKKILEYRQYTKLKSTYADGLAAFIQADGRIHTVFRQTVTATGRLSSTDPNLQNIPVRMELGREIRKLFVPQDGWVFVDADYSQIELRILAHMSGDPQLIDAYNQAQDIHAITASKVFHVPLEEVTPLMRRNAKAVNFGIVYGISAFGLSEDLSISRKEALDYIEEYFRTYPGVKTFLDNCVKEAKEKGYSITMYGRRRPIPELTSSQFMQRSFGERVAMNAPIQGTAADIMKIAMIRVEERLKKEGLKTRLLLQVHDELILEAPQEEAEYTEKLLQEEMQKAAELKVKLEVDCHAGASWYDAK